MSDWQPIDKAKKDGTLYLLKGTLEGDVDLSGHSVPCSPSSIGKTTVVGSWFEDKGIARHDTRGDIPWDKSRWLMHGVDYYAVTIEPTEFHKIPK